MPDHRVFMLHPDGILASDGGPAEFVAQYLNEPPETCTYQYAYGRVCSGGRMEHKWWEGRGCTFEEAFARLRIKLRKLYEHMPQDPAILIVGGWKANF